MRRLLLPLTLALLVRGQTPQPAPAEDVSQTLSAFSAQAQRLKPILDQLTPPDWVKEGAPQAYVDQWQNARQELGTLANTLQSLTLAPERMPLALDAYFRWQEIESRLNSLTDGVRKYQNPAVGDLLAGVIAENASNRDKLRQYISDLAAQKEQEFAVVDKEAQRCRTQVNRPAPPKPAAPKAQGKAQ
jgi:hypothetical protein